MIPETAKRIREVLKERGLAPNKKLGQHFLADPNLRDAVVAAGRVAEGDFVLEVGPGLGTLTKALLDAGAKVLAVELDRGLAAFLAEAFEGREGLTLLHADALDKKNLAPRVREALREGRAGAQAFKLVANLPYGAGTPLLTALARDESPDLMTVMVQKEVAERMSARPGSRAYGPLAVLLSLLGRSEILREVGGKVFAPRASVRSAIVRFTPAPAPPEDWRLADRIARDAFRFRRKSLRRGLLHAGHPAERVEEALAEIGTDSVVRAEDLSPQQFVSLGRTILTPSI